MKIIPVLAAAVSGALSVAFLAAVSWDASAASTKSASSGVRKVIDQATPLPEGARDDGLLPRTTQLSVTLSLRPRLPDELDADVDAVSDPASSQYGHFITPSQFLQRYGASRQTIENIEQWASSAGLRAARISALAIVLTGTAQNIEAAFDTKLDAGTLATGRPVYRNSSEASVPPSIASAVDSVAGLNNVAEPASSMSRTRDLARADESQPIETSGQTDVAVGGPVKVIGASPGAAHNCAPLPGGVKNVLTPGQMKSAYNFAALKSTGAGQHIALVEFGGLDEPNNVACYQKQFGSSATVYAIPVDGGPSSESVSAVEEETLDVEVAASFAPNATIDIYQLPDATEYTSHNSAEAALIDAYSAIANETAAHDSVVSISWDICEPGLSASDAAAEETVFKQMAVEGLSVMVASGDYGSQACLSGGVSRATEGLSVDEPADDPYVTAVGGTSLTVDRSGARRSESAWNDTAEKGLVKYASGGGMSTRFDRPTWQSAPGVGSGAYSGKCGAANCREVPDVSAAAGGNSYYYEYVGSKWISEGGTSASAPLWAGLTADLNQYCGAARGFLNPALYELARDGYAGINDITSGDNINYAATVSGVGGWPATTGYDMVTGLGSPSVAALAEALCGRDSSGSGKKIDIVFVIDTTGSMSPYIDSTVAAASSVVDALDAAHVDYRIGLVDYKDSDYGCGDYDSVTDLPFSNNRAEILAAISGLADKVGGGCDIPEDVYSGIDRALSFPWRSGVTKAVIQMGDAPGHDPEPHSGLTLAKIAAHAAAVDPAQIYPILIGSDPDAHTFDQAMADATGGETFDGTSDPSAAGSALVEAIDAIINRPVCTSTITGAAPDVYATTGTTCIENATVTGSVVAAPGASVDIEGSAVSGHVVASNRPSAVRICGSTTGPIDVELSPGFVQIGEPGRACAGNVVHGVIDVRGNSGGVVVEGNTVAQVLAAGNSGTGPEGEPVTISGNHP